VGGREGEGEGARDGAREIERGERGMEREVESETDGESERSFFLRLSLTPYLSVLLRPSVPIRERLRASLRLYQRGGGNQRGERERD